MKKIIICLAIVALFIGVFFGIYTLYNKLSDKVNIDNLSHNSQQTEHNEQDNKNVAPDFTVLDNEGNSVKLSDFKGKPVVINFWATWCFYCKEEMPDFDLAYKNYPDVKFLMINATDGVQETMSKAQQYIKEQNFQFDVYFDTNLDAVKTYNVTGFPTTIFIDKDGNIVTGASGMLNYETLQKGIDMITE